MNLIFFGPPGCGKGTQSAKLVAQQDYAHISTGDTLRTAIKEKTPLGLQAEKIINAGNLVSDDIVTVLVRERLAKLKESGQSFVLDGYPRTLPQIQSLSKMLNELSYPDYPTVLLFEIPEKELISRLQGRGRADDSLEVIQKRFDIYRAEVESILSHCEKDAYPIKKLQAHEDIEVVYGNILDVIKKG